MSDLYAILTNEPETRQPSQPSASEAAEPARKRPRVNQACETCRDRKTRCGGERPVCLACERRGVGNTCSYERSAVKRKAVSLGPAELPEQNHQFPTPHRRERQSSPFAVSTGFAPINKSSFQDNSHRSAEANAKAPLPYASDRQSDAPERGQPRESNGAYGPSTTAVLLNTISDEPQNVVADPQPLILGQRKPASTRNAPRPPEKMFVSDGSQAVLPRRRDADDYVRCYWDFIHPLFPVLHRPSFMNQYEQLWSSDNDVEQPEFEENMFMSALNIVFAIGCRFSKLVPNDHKVSVADEFYQRSRRTFCYDVLDTATLSMIQLLLLAVVYLQSTHHAVRCWNATGLAVRAGQSIGLHLENSGEKSQLHVEMRRRIWHTCISLDRLVAMIFGRPVSMEKTDLPLPSMIDDENLSEEGFSIQPRGQLSKLGLFRYSCEIFDVLGDILSTFYTGKPVLSERYLDDQPHKVLTSIFGFNKRIDDIVARLPDWLAVESEVQTESHVRLQQRVLRSRILMTRLLATRPVLLLATNQNYSGRTSSHTMEEDMMRSCSVRCLTTAQDLIRDTYGHLAVEYRPTAWHTTMFTCLSLMVLLSAVTSGQVAADDAAVHSSWDQAITILEYYQEQVPAAAEGIRTLQSLKKQLLASQRVPDKTLNQNLGHVPTPASLEPNDEVDIGELNFGFDDITDTWFTQHFFDASWQDMPSL